MKVNNKQFIRDYLGSKRFASPEYWEAKREAEQEQEYSEYIMYHGYMISPDEYEQTIRY